MTGFVAAVVTLLGTAARAQDTVVKLGHVAPTSGRFAAVGIDMENSARMAVDQLNATGVVIGGTKVRLELVPEDDGNDPKRAVAVAQQMVGLNVAGVIGHLNLRTTMLASRIYSAAGIPQIAPSATNSRYTRQGFNTAFRMLADDSRLGSALGTYVVKELKGKSIAVIDDGTAYGHGLVENFTKAVKARGGEIAETQYTGQGATDFIAILTLVKAKNPDVIFFGGTDTVAGPIIRQMKQLGIDAKFVGGDGICSTVLPKLADGAVADNQVVCAEAGGMEVEQQFRLAEFREQFRRRFGTEPQRYAPCVYDAVNVIVAAMIKAGSSDPKVYLPVLASTVDYKGLTGPISFDEKGDVKNALLTLFTFRGEIRQEIGVVR
ncbi:MAG: branched-chain amino acid ABC transporter substrate-binding protein [Burkholderiales bacterium]